MALPIAANTTGDLYRAGNSPPATPDAAALAVYLQPSYALGLEAGEHVDERALKFTHLLLVDAGVDIRDDYGLSGIGSNADSIYIPDRNGTLFSVLFVERRQRGTPQDHKRVYLRRSTPGWPTTEL
jgi:hypothetical protein